MAKNQFSKIIRDMFEENEELTLRDLYEDLSKNDDIDIDASTLRHRIRSSLFSLKQSGHIKRVSDATYKKA